MELYIPRENAQGSPSRRWTALRYMAPKRKQSGTPRQPSPNMGFLEFTAGRPTARTPARPVPSQPAPPTALITTDLLDLDQIAGSSCVPVRPRQVRGPEVVAQGPALRPVQSVPDDWRLAAELLVDSPESLKWCRPSLPHRAM